MMSNTVWEVFTDGGSRGNPGPAAIGGLVRVADSSLELYEFSEYIDTATNNEAEYRAIEFVLEWCKNNLDSFEGKKPIKINCYLDSKLVVEQLSRNWKIKEPRMRSFAHRIWSTLDECALEVTFSHIPRAQNAAADALVNQALDAAVA